MVDARHSADAARTAVPEVGGSTTQAVASEPLSASYDDVVSALDSATAVHVVGTLDAGSTAVKVNLQLNADSAAGRCPRTGSTYPSGP